MATKFKGRQLEASEIEVGGRYRAKRFRDAGLGVTNDREVLWVSPDRRSVQYDSDSVARGRRYPTVAMVDFLVWVSHRVEEG